MHRSRSYHGMLANPCRVQVAQRRVARSCHSSLSTSSLRDSFIETCLASCPRSAPRFKASAEMRPEEAPLLLSLERAAPVLLARLHGLRRLGFVLVRAERLEEDLAHIALQQAEGAVRVRLGLGERVVDQRGKKLGSERGLVLVGR